MVYVLFVRIMRHLKIADGRDVLQVWMVVPSRTGRLFLSGVWSRS